MEVGLLSICVFTALFSLVAKRLSVTIITAPMAFLLLGWIIAQTGWISSHAAEQFLHPVAEVTLVILLFLDAAQTDLNALRKSHIWPSRMLLIGLPLVTALGTLAAWPFLAGWPLIAVALVAAILTPTDAALGQAVVANSAVPPRVRRGLTVESGLNDGLALPAVLLFASLTAGAEAGDWSYWLSFSAAQLLLGPLAGVAVGYMGGQLLLLSHKHSWTSEQFEGVGALAMAAACYLFADVIGGNGFIAAFVGGLTFGHIVQGRCRFVYEFTESEGQLLSWSAFFLLGLALVPEAITHLTWPMLGLILVSLLVVRPLAIWISLIGTDAASVTRLFFGWFGPRGLATALFALLVADQIAGDVGEQVLNIAINTVWISALLHGITATPAAKAYAQLVAKMGPCPETIPVPAPHEQHTAAINKGES